MFVRTVAIGVGLLGAVATSQLPEFAQQYVQRLGGAVDELAVVVQRFDADARNLGLDRDQAIGRLRGNQDDLARRRADAARDDAARLQRLQPHYQEMRSSSALGRVAGLTTAADPHIARRTFQDFQPAVPATAAGLATALVGFLLGLVLVYGVRAGAKRVLPPARKNPFRPAAASGPSRKR